jgi:hypothetical protein
VVIGYATSLVPAGGVLSSLFPKCAFIFSNWMRGNAVACEMLAKFR